MGLTRKGDLPVRTLQEVRLHEFGPVTFPAYAAATAGIRSVTGFRDWQNASEEQRSAIAKILGTSSTEELAALIARDSEPLATTPARIHTHAENRALLDSTGVTRWLAMKSCETS